MVSAFPGKGQFVERKQHRNSMRENYFPRPESGLIPLL